MTNKLVLFAHPVAQPSRAVIWLLALLGIEYELKVTMPGPDGTGAASFLDIFPLGTIPALQVIGDDGKTILGVTEYLAIAEYICAIAGEKGDKFMPKDPVVRAKVIQSCLHGVIAQRSISTDIFRPLFVAFLSKQPCTLTKDQINAFLTPKFEGNVVDMSRAAGWTVAKHDGSADELVENPPSVFLVPEAGNAPTAADFINYAETYQLEVLGLLGEIDARRPAFKRWHDAMKNLPGWDKVHETINGFVKANLECHLPK